MYILVVKDAGVKEFELQKLRARCKVGKIGEQSEKETVRIASQ